MIGAEGFLGGIGGAAGEVFGFDEFAGAGKVAGEVVPGIESFEMIGAAQGFSAMRRTSRYSGSAAAYLAWLKRAFARPRWLRRVRALSGPTRSGRDGDQFAEHGFGFGVILLAHDGVREVVAIDQSVRMLGAEDLFLQGDHFSILRRRRRHVCPGPAGRWPGRSGRRVCRDARGPGLFLRRPMRSRKSVSASANLPWLMQNFVEPQPADEGIGVLGTKNSFPGAGSHRGGLARLREYFPW